MKPSRVFATLLAASLLAAIPATADVLNTQTNSTFTSIQAAIDDAATRGGTNALRVQAGHYPEQIVIPPTAAAGGFEILGGWNKTFTARNLDPAVTVIDAQGSGRPLSVQLNGGLLHLAGLTFTGGFDDTGSGGGAARLLLKSGALVINGTRLVNSTVQGASASGGGLWAKLQGTAVLIVADSTIAGNTLSPFGSAAEGGGMAIDAGGSSIFELRSSRIEDNTIDLGSTAAFQSTATLGGGLFLLVSDGASAEVLGNTVDGNSVSSNQRTQFPQGLAGALVLAPGSTGLISARQNRWLGGTLDWGAASQVLLVGFGTGRLDFTDSIVADGPSSAIDAAAFSQAELYLTNLTVTQFPAGGVRLNVGGLGKASLYNSIVFDTDWAIDASERADTDFNLTTDPLFRNPAARDFRLLGASPAIDAGTAKPPGGLGGADVDGALRQIGKTVDLGAHETNLRRGANQ